MNDQPRDTSRRRSTRDSGDSGQGGAGAHDASMPMPGDDPDAALQRLQSMGTGAPSGDQRPLRQQGESSPPYAAEPRVYSPAPRAKRARSRPAATAGRRPVARIAAPVVFLIAVIALVSIAIQSGVIGGDEPATNPTPAATNTKAPKPATKKYTVKSGDTLSGIAAKFDTTVIELQDLNPSLSSTTLAVGIKIKVPK